MLHIALLLLLRFFLDKKELQELVPENSKNNSESFDVLTGTMSPDSELFSFGLSSSSSG